MEDRLERPIERLTQQINALGEKIRGTQSIIPADGGSTYKKAESPVLTPTEKSRERQKAIEFGKALGIGNYAPKGKLEDLTPSAIRSTVGSAIKTESQKEEVGVLGMIGKVIGAIIKIINYAAIYKLIKPYIEKWFGKNIITNTLFGIMDPIVGIIDSVKQMFLNWFKNTFPETYNTITGIIDSVKNAFSWVWEKIKGMYGWAKDFFKSEEKEQFLADTWKNIKEDLKTFIEQKIGKENLDALTGVWNALSEATDSLMKTVKEFVESPDKKQFLSDTWEDIKLGIKDWFKSIGMKFTDEEGKELSFFDALMKYIREEVYEKHLKKHVDGIFNELSQTVKNIIGQENIDKFNKIVNDLEIAIENAKNISIEILELMKDPLGYIAKKTGEAVAEMATDAAAKVKDGVSNLLKNSTPPPTTPTTPTGLPTGSVATMYSPGSSHPTGKKPEGKQLLGRAPSRASFFTKESQDKQLSGEASNRASLVTKKADDFLVSKRGDFVNFSNQDNIIGFKDGGSVDRVLRKKDDALITDTKEILVESRKQVSLLQRIVDNTYNANLLLQKLNNKSGQSTTNVYQSKFNDKPIKFNRSEFDLETLPNYNLHNQALA